MARSSFTDLKDPLARALRHIAEAGSGGALEVVWRDAAGALLAARSRPVRLARGALTLECDPDFAVDLERASDLLCTRLNARLGRGAVRRLIIIPCRGADSR